MESGLLDRPHSDGRQSFIFTRTHPRSQRASHTYILLRRNTFTSESVTDGVVIPWISDVRLKSKSENRRIRQPRLPKDAVHPHACTSGSRTLPCHNYILIAMYPILSFLPVRDLDLFLSHLADSWAALTISSLRDRPSVRVDCLPSIQFICQCRHGSRTMILFCLLNGAGSS